MRTVVLLWVTPQARDCLATIWTPPVLRETCISQPVVRVLHQNPSCDANYSENTHLSELLKLGKVGSW